MSCTVQICVRMMCMYVLCVQLAMWTDWSDGSWACLKANDSTICEYYVCIMLLCILFERNCVEGGLFCWRKGP